MTSEHVSNGTSASNGGNGGNGDQWASLQRLCLVSGGIGLAVYAVFGLAHSAIGESGGVRQFFVSYLIGWTFWLALPVGAMGLIGIQFVTGASWGVLLRRPFEAATKTLPLMAVLFIPLALSVFSETASPYPWSSNPESIGTSPGQVEELKQRFAAWSNPPGYVLRIAIYFVMWALCIYLMNKWGDQVEQTNDVKARRFAENFSGPVVIVFTLGNMFAVTDIVMSVNLGFSSTMFPLIYSVTQLLVCLAFSIAVFLSLSEHPPLKDVLRPKFQIDMGSFMLGLTLIWTYMNFSQYMLIWIGNLPEEIPYYLKRRDDLWITVAWVLGLFHFALPFFLLLFRDVKLHRVRLRAVATFLVIMCGVDVIWWIQPASAPPGFPFYLIMDVAALVGIGGIWGWVFLGQLRKHPLLPTNYIGQLPGGHHAH